MSKLGINTGRIPNDGTGDTLLSGAVKINRNFDEIYNYFGDGTNLTFTSDGSSRWARTSPGIHTLSNVGIGTTNPRFALEVGSVGSSGTTLLVNGDARVTGILSVGQGTVTINGNNDTITASNIVITSSITGSGVSGFLTTGNLVGYATEGYVNSAIVGFITTGALSGYATETFVTNSLVGYTTEGYVNNAVVGFITSGALTGYATQGYVDSAVSGISTGSGGSSQWVTTAAGIHTLSSVGIGTTNPTSKLTVQGDVSVSGVSTFVSPNNANNVIINVAGAEPGIYWSDSNGSYLGFTPSISVNTNTGDVSISGGTGNLQLFAPNNGNKDVIIKAGAFNPTAIHCRGNAEVELYYQGSQKFETLGTGVTVTGTTFTNQLSVSENVNISGVLTASQINGTIIGSIDNAVNLTGGTANASSLNVSGIATISSGRIQADASANLRFGNSPAGSGSGRNIAIGDQVLVSLSGGLGRNIGIGELSYHDTTTGQYNIGIGERAGQKVTTGAYNVILGAYDGNSDNLDIRTSSRNVVIADGEGNIRQYINSSGNVGIKTTVVTEALTVAGVVSATSFYGTLNAGQLTGSLPAIDGSALIGVVATGTGVEVQDDTTPVGTAGTINFDSNLSVSFTDGTATVSGASSVSAATTAYALAGTPNLNVGVVTANNFVTPFGSGQGFAVYNNPGPFQTTVVNLGGYYAEMGYRSYISDLYIGGALKDNAGAWSIFNTGQALFSSTVSSGSGFIVGDPSTVNINSSGINAAGIITASSFSGSAAGLTNIPSGQLTGALPAIDGSALLNVTASGTGVGIHDDQVNVGSATTIDFGTGLDVTFSAGVATVTASGGSLQSRTTVTGVTTSIANNGIGNTNITGFKSYALLKVGLSTAGWLRLYTDSASRANDVSRSVGEDPAPGSGVIAEVVTTGISTTQIISPFVMGGNLDNPVDTTIYAAITNLSGSTQAITANLTILQLEA